MAPSPSEVSILNSTSRLFSYLDLNNEQQQEMQNIDEMDIDQVMDVPDTPDRLARKINSGEELAKEYNSSVMCDSGNSDFLNNRAPNRPRSCFRSTIRTGNNGNLRRLHSHRRGDPSFHDGTDQINHTFVSVSDSPSIIPKSARSSRRTIGDQVFKESATMLSALPHGHRGSSDVANVGGDTSAIAEVLASDPKFQDKKMKKSMPRNNTSRDTGKTTYTEIPSISISCEDDNNVLNSTLRSEYTGVPGRDRSRGAYKDVPAKEFRKGLIGCSSRGISNSSKPSNDVYEWKKNTDDDTHIPSGAVLDHGKGIDLSCDSKPKAEQITSTRNIGQRRLLRNGCISPYNIARAKHTSESHIISSQGGQDDAKVISNGGSPSIEIHNIASNSEASRAEQITSTRNIGQRRLLRNGCGQDDAKVISNGGIPSIEIHNIASNSEASQSIRMDKVKGKGVMVDPPQAKEYDAKTIHLTSRSLNSTEEGIGIRDSREDDFRCPKEIDGWRSTHSRSKITSSELSDEVEHLSRRNSGVDHLLDQSQGSRNGNGNYASGINTGPQNDFLAVSDHVSFQRAPRHSVQASSSATSELGPENGRRGRVNKITKRPRKHSLAPSNLSECSTSDFDDSEIAYLCSSGERATARSTRSRDPHHSGISGPIIEIDELSPEIRCRKPEDTGQMVNGNSDARSRQMEADEILARQLQEQFYHELPPGVGGGENDASIAWRLQQQEDSQRLSLGGQRISHHRDSSMSHLYRQYPSDSLPNSSIRSAATRARGSLYTRTQRLRNNFRRPPAISSSRGRHSRFPPNMDIDTRIHILEALEAAVSDRDSMNSHFFQVQRDFNENDYEMLLALDENNHQHVGATLNQINGLPQSTVQTENIEEACAICLETPTIGDTIRHLPCLHKFHKDCIDQWLRRSTSCPVCKSGIN
ncbi:zinc finger protein [Macleaya cordata]|uniref:Zinc finger protein n=1 Tax=Macleaya cordata TaxID=56857 RepID=A0A200PTN6_MACCD|nr:zinc finger protein [Macleaya cordata]